MEFAPTINHVRPRQSSKLNPNGSSERLCGCPVAIASKLVISYEPVIHFLPLSQLGRVAQTGMIFRGLHARVPPNRGPRQRSAEPSRKSGRFAPLRQNAFGDVRRISVFKTYMPVANDPKWVIIDANGLTLGRLATSIATLIRGKHKPDYTPHLGNGDFVIVINAEKVVLTGNKLDGKIYTRYTGYQGGLRTETARQAIDKHPDRVIEHAVFGMLPKGRMGRSLHTHLKVYKGDVHPHAAQKPVKLELAHAKYEAK